MVERKVPLPGRWLRGFAEVQVLTAAFEPRAEIPAAEAAAFLRRLPGGADRSVLWAVPAGRTLRLTSRPAPGAVCLAGAGRLAALRGLLRHARTLRVYGPPVRAGSPAVPSTWELDTGTLRLSLTLSPSRTGGSPARARPCSHSPLTRWLTTRNWSAALLSWDPTIDVAALADAAGLPDDRVRAALAQLGTAGRVGYDVAEGGYFHRVMPYDAGRAERDNPRLVGARVLVERGAVHREGEHATVRSGDEVYRVRRLPDGAYTCSCRWWGRHRGQRGPCKHALAVSMVAAPAEVGA